jgi:hypothetical protein
MEFPVARARRPQGELVDAVAREGRVCVAVDEARHRGEPARVELLDVSVEASERAHLPPRLDHPVAAEDVRVGERVERAEIAAAERRDTAGRRRQLRQVADEEPVTRRTRCHSAGAGADG